MLSPPISRRTEMLPDCTCQGIIYPAIPCFTLDVICFCAPRSTAIYNTPSNRDSSISVDSSLSSAQPLSLRTKDHGLDVQLRIFVQWYHNAHFLLMETPAGSKCTIRDAAAASTCFYYLLLPVLPADACLCYQLWGVDAPGGCGWLTPDLLTKGQAQKKQHRRGHCTTHRRRVRSITALIKK